MSVHEPYQNMHMEKASFLPFDCIHVARDRSENFSASKKTHEAFHLQVKHSWNNAMPIIRPLAFLSLIHIYYSLQCIEFKCTCNVQ